MSQIVYATNTRPVDYELEQLLKNHCSLEPKQGFTEPGTVLKADAMSEPVKLAEQLLKFHLGELGFSFAEEELPELAGFMISEDGFRRVVVAANLDDTSRVCLYLHLLGHIALEHIDDTKLDVRYEARMRCNLPATDQVEEYLADIWAVDFIKKRLTRTCRHGNPFMEGALTVAKRLKVPRTVLRRQLGRVTEFFCEVDTVRQWRIRPEVQALLAAIHWCLEGSHSVYDGRKQDHDNNRSRAAKG